MFLRSGRKSPRYVIFVCLGMAATYSLYHSAGVFEEHLRQVQVSPLHDGPPRNATLTAEELVLQETKPHAYKYTLGPPTRHFRDNVRRDMRYVVTWPWDGMTNSITIYHNLIWHAILTRRVAVIPPFKPLHIGVKESNLPFGEVFDVPRLSETLGIGIIEWRDLKLKPQSPNDTEEIGCWSTFMSHHFGDALHSSSEGDVGLDISQWSVPVVANLTDDIWWSHDHVLASLDLKETRRELLLHPPYPPKPSITGRIIEPDTQMQCFDFMYRVKGLGFYQCSLEWQPSWNYVGRHIHFNKRVEDITRAALRKTFKLGSEDDIPPFIAIHVRHGDFKIACYDTPVDDCFAPLSRYALRVEQVQKQLQEEHNVDAKLVLMTSDERNATWWEEVNKLGWARIDFAGEPQDEILGKWHPIIIDSAAHSIAAGFVGTDRSTVSIISAQRNHAWSYGATRTVSWGSPTADADRPDTLFSQNITDCIADVADKYGP